MRRNGFILVICSLLLSGCWDEKQYKDVTNVALFGIEGQPGNIKSIFAFPVFEDDSISYSTVTGSGISARGAKNNTNTAEGLDIAELQVLLLAEDSAKSDIYKYLDMLYRDPRNRLSAHLAIVEGELKPYFEPVEGQGDDIATYYSELIVTAATYTLIPKINLQEVCTLLFTEDMSLALPYIIISKESGAPAIAGSALFNKREYTGEILDIRESQLLNLLKNKKSNYLRLDYLWKDDGEESPLAINVLDIKKDWEISDKRIDATYKVKVDVEEFSHDSLNKTKTIKDVEDFLSREMTKELNELTKRLQEAKSDAVGFGRPVRAFHPKLWEKGEWTDTFSELPINIKAKVEIPRSGILN